MENFFHDPRWIAGGVCGLRCNAFFHLLQNFKEGAHHPSSREPGKLIGNSSAAPLQKTSATFDPRNRRFCMSSSATTSQANDGQLGLFDAISIIIGIIIGVGIYETPTEIFQMMSGPWTTLALWAICGLLALACSLCYAELATTYPRSGGDYVYLTRAYGPLVGYFFGWTQLAVIQTGSIGLMAFVFADYGARLWNIEAPEIKMLFASAAIMGMTLLNLMGVVLGKSAQNLLSLAKVLGLGGIIVAGF